MERRKRRGRNCSRLVYTCLLIESIHAPTTTPRVLGACFLPSVHLPTLLTVVTCEYSTAKIVLEQAAATNSPRFLISDASSPNSSSIVVHRSRKLWENRPLADDLQIIDQHQRSMFSARIYPTPLSSITPLQLVRGGEGATYIRSSLPSLPIPHSYVPTFVLSPSNSLSHCSPSPRS